MKKPQSRLSSEMFLKIIVLSCFIVFLLIAVVACGGPNFNKNTRNESVSDLPQMTDFERDMKSMRTANFEYIYIFRRKDGGVFDAEDKTYLRENRPAEANRFIMSDEEKAYIAGSNYPFPEESLKTLSERFDIEDISIPKKKENKENRSNNENSEDNSANK